MLCFSNYNLTTSSGNHLKAISHAHIVNLMHKLIFSARGFYDLSVPFHRGRNIGQRELTNNRNKKVKYHVRILLNDIFGFSGFSQHQEKATFGLGYKLIITRNSDNAVLKKDNANKTGKIKANSIEWFIPHYTHSIPQQAILS